MNFVEQKGEPGTECNLIYIVVGAGGSNLDMQVGNQGVSYVFTALLSGSGNMHNFLFNINSMMTHLVQRPFNFKFNARCALHV